LPGVFEAEIHFSTTPNVGSPVVAVTLTVEGLIPPINLAGSYDCTDVSLTWEMPTGGNPDSWNVYRDGTLLDNVTVMAYTDPMVDPEVEYCYHITAVYAGEESMPTDDFCITVPTPDDLEPLNLEGFADMPDENDVTLTWDAPAACLAPDGYNVFRDGSQVNTSLVTELTYVDLALTAGFYEYYVVAVYYFGESASSNPAYVLITGIEEPDADMFRIFPNPATDLVNVNSTYEIKTIQVLNNIGQVVIDEEVNTMNYKFNVSTFERGIYYIKLDTDEGQVIRKIAVK
ncbi:MAG: T9SS type A sorting domain-containing protein, partial [Bacteroidales bacterium]|nr:T9SS type A sorting domain-containing protein [Bacteroidales bacterium]